MFAAARFSDLPELRDLRQIFQERYGNCLDYSVNQEVISDAFGIIYFYSIMF